MAYRRALKDILRERFIYWLEDLTFTELLKDIACIFILICMLNWLYALWESL